MSSSKRAAGVRAADLVEDGMRLGLGTGSTVFYFLEALGQRIRDEGLKVTGVPTSIDTQGKCAEFGIALATLADVDALDLTIDGADEIDGDFQMIKGGGGALLQEKIVATASDQMIVIADIGKEVETLGAFPLPVEVIPFGWQTTKALVEEMLISMDVLGRNVTLRMNGEAPFVTDEGNHIVDLHLSRIGDARKLSLVLNQIPGVVENGLFIDICDKVVIGHQDGLVEVIDINEGTHHEDRITFADDDNIFSDL